MLDATVVDDVFEYVRAQTNKIDPVLEQVKRPNFADQLVESYIADLVLFLMERLGPKRAEIFKRQHLGIKPEKQFAAQTLYNTPGSMTLGEDKARNSRNNNYRAATTMYATVDGK